METWRFNAKAITKYNPIYRDINGIYLKEDWVGYFQIGKQFNNQILTFKTYLEEEDKYVRAASLFFEFHIANKIVVRNVELINLMDYEYDEKNKFLVLYEQIIGGDKKLSVSDLSFIVRMILRELIWAEIFSEQSDEVAIRFGFDFYMYFSSDKDLNKLFPSILDLGLFIS